MLRSLAAFVTVAALAAPAAARPDPERPRQADAKVRDVQGNEGRVPSDALWL